MTAGLLLSYLTVSVIQKSPADSDLLGFFIIFEIKSKGIFDYLFISS